MSARNPPVPAASAMRPPTGPVAAGKLHTMKEVCEECGMTYETLKFYCNRGLVPNVKRDANNRRVFDDRDVAWLKSLSCLKRCNMSISEMQHYLDPCARGKATIPERKAFLAAKHAELERQMEQIQAAIDYIDWKQEFYDDVLSGKTEYFSYVAPED